MTSEQFLTTADLAGLMRTSPATVRYWRHKKTGPTGVRIGRRVLYRREDVDTWVRERARAQRAAA